MDTQQTITARRYSLAWFLARILGKVTSDPQEQSNFFWLNIANIGFYGAFFLCQGELLNTYIAKCGFSNEQLGTITMFTGLAGSIGMFMFMGWSDKFKRRLLAVANMGFLLLIHPVGIIALLLYYPNQKPHIAFLYGIIVLSVVNALIYSLSWMVEMAVFVRTIRENVRGRAWGSLGIVAALINIFIFAQIARWAQAKFEPNVAVIICMGMGIALWVLRSVSFLMQRELPDLLVCNSEVSTSASVNPFRAFVDIMKVPRCRALIYPQILRGGAGVMAAFIIPFAVKSLDTPETFGAHMATMGQVGLIMGSLLVVLLRDRLGSGLVVFIGDVMVGAGFGLLFATHSWVGILPLYALIAIGSNIEGSAIPLGTFTVIPAEIIGAFSGVRMTTSAIVAALASKFGGQLLDVVNPLVVFGVVAALKVINALWFWWVFSVHKPVEQPTEQLEAEVAGS